MCACEHVHRSVRAFEFSSRLADFVLKFFDEHEKLVIIHVLGHFHMRKNSNEQLLELSVPVFGVHLLEVLQDNPSLFVANQLEVGQHLFFGPENCGQGLEGRGARLVHVHLNHDSETAL